MIILDSADTLNSPPPTLDQLVIEKLSALKDLLPPTDKNPIILQLESNKTTLTKLSDNEQLRKDLIKHILPNSNSVAIAIYDTLAFDDAQTMLNQLEKKKADLDPELKKLLRMYFYIKFLQRSARGKR